MCAAASLFSRKRQKLKNKAPTPIPNPSSRPFGSGKKKKKKEPASVGCVGTGERVRREGRGSLAASTYVKQQGGSSVSD